MKYRSRYILFLALVAMGKLATAQEPPQGSFSLQQAIDYAVKHSPNYLNAELDFQSAEYRRKEIRGLGLPQLNGSVDIKDYIELPTSLIPAAAFNPAAPADQFAAVRFGTKYNGTLGVDASQLIFSSDYIFALKASKEFMNLSKISVTRSKAELASQVSKAYYTVIINKDRVKLLDANIGRLKKIYEDTRALNEQGFAEQIDVSRLEVQYNNLQTELEKTAKLIQLSETFLKFQMGYELSDPISLSDSLNMDAESFRELSDGRIDITQRPDYQLMLAQQTLLDIDVKRLKWGYMPTLVAYGTYQLNSQRNRFDFLGPIDKNDPTKQWFKIALIGATLKLNIFDGFQRHNQIQQSKISAIKNQNMIRNIELGGQLEASMASINYSNAYATLQSQKRNMELALHVVDVAQKKYLGGVGSNIEVVTAETSLKEAQTNYYNAVYDMLVARIEYQKATGTLIK
jgi:outer membrane protein TolC